VLLMWFYFSGLAILVGAEVNAEIEHASPYGKSVGEKVPGEKKKIGPAAARDYEDKKAKGIADAPPFPDDVNCDIEPKRAPRHDGLRPSDLVIGAVVLAPAAVKIVKDVRERANGESGQPSHDTNAA
jgi:hypothetical protein